MTVNVEWKKTDWGWQLVASATGCVLAKVVRKPGKFLWTACTSGEFGEIGGRCVSLREAKVTCEIEAGVMIR